MPSPDIQPTWVPYETIKDCSQGFCSFYCPQWCYTIFPPPPPLGFADDPSSGPNLSPLVIAVIGILASACLLVGYYTIISKYCGWLDSLRRRLGRDTPTGGGGDGGEGDDEGPDGAFRHEEWYTPANGGLEESVIKSIGVLTYRRGEGLVDGADCSVCLGEFRDDESLRLLPKCSHAFHVACIDTWLKSHANCPLCRAHILSPCATAPSPLPPPPVEPTSPLEPRSTAPLPEIRQDEDPERGREGEEDHARVGGGGATVMKNLLRIHTELGGLNRSDAIVELGDGGVQPIRRSFSMDATRLSRASVAHVLGIDMEANFAAPAAKEDFTDMAEGEWSSKGALGEQHACKAGGRSRALHCVVRPVRMKRSFSSGRFRFPGRQGRGNHSLGILPL